MTSLPPFPRGPLTDGRVVLRRPQPDADLPEIAVHRHDEQASAWLSARSVPFDPAALLAEYLAGWRGEENRLGLTLVIGERPAERLVGVVHLDARDATLVASYGVAPAERRRGLATAACELVAGWALSAGFVAVELGIDADNVASRGVAERAGFTIESRARGVIVFRRAVDR